MDERYRRNRVALAEQAHVSPSAISQYVCGRATPSLDVLVKLAEIFDVSLDYLVLGREPAGPPPELGYLTGHFEAHIRSARVQEAALHDLTAHIGAEIGGKIASLVRSTAEELSAAGMGIAGMLSPTEVAMLERCDAQTTIVTSDLSSEVVVLADDGNESAAAPSMYSRVVAENIAEGNRYEYIVPDDPELRRTAALLRQELVRLTGLDTSTMDKRLRIRHVSRGCIPAFVIHHVVMQRIADRAPSLADRITRFVYPDPTNNQMGFVATITPASSSNQYFSLIIKENVPQIMLEAEALRQARRVALARQK